MSVLLGLGLSQQLYVTWKEGKKEERTQRKLREGLKGKWREIGGLPLYSFHQIVTTSSEVNLIKLLNLNRICRHLHSNDRSLWSWAVFQDRPPIPALLLDREINFSLIWVTLLGGIGEKWDTQKSLYHNSFACPLVEDRNHSWKSLSFRIFKTNFISFKLPVSNLGRLLSLWLPGLCMDQFLHLGSFVFPWHFKIPWWCVLAGIFSDSLSEVLSDTF